jgi:anti-sigma B factor antagonist
MPVTARLRASFPQLSAHDHGDVTIVTLRGELDTPAVSALRAHLSDLRSRGRLRCVVDLTGLTSISNACLGVLVRHGKETRGQDGSFALAAPHGAIRDALSVNGLLSRFEVHDTVEQAIAKAVPPQPQTAASP